MRLPTTDLTTRIASLLSTTLLALPGALGTPLPQEADGIVPLESARATNSEKLEVGEAGFLQEWDENSHKLTWTFQLDHPGKYRIQAITDASQKPSAQIVRIQVNGLDRKLRLRRSKPFRQREGGPL